MAKRIRQLSDFLAGEHKRLKNNLGEATSKGIVPKEELLRRKEKLKGIKQLNGVSTPITIEGEVEQVKNAKNKKNEKY